MLICFTGPKGSGKDTAAQPLLDVGFVRINLADELKWLCAEVFDFSPLSMESQVEKERLFDKPLVINEEHISKIVGDEYHRIADGPNQSRKVDIAIVKMETAYLGLQLHSLRALLQWIGTAFRDQVDQHFWINIWRDKVLSARASLGRVVCTDVRYANERQAVRDIGGVLVYIDRPDCGTGDSHASENDFGHMAEYHRRIVNTESVKILQERAAAIAITGHSALLKQMPLDALHLYYTGLPAPQESPDA